MYYIAEGPIQVLVEASVIVFAVDALDAFHLCSRDFDVRPVKHGDYALDALWLIHDADTGIVRTEEGYSFQEWNEMGIQHVCPSCDNQWIPQEWIGKKGLLIGQCPECRAFGKPE